MSTRTVTQCDGCGCEENMPYPPLERPDGGAWGGVVLPDGWGALHVPQPRLPCSECGSASWADLGEMRGFRCRKCEHVVGHKSSMAWRREARERSPALTVCPACIATLTPASGPVEARVAREIEASWPRPEGT